MNYEMRTSKDPLVIRARIMSRVTIEPNGCWLYRKGSRTKNGRHGVRFEGRQQYVYRVMWQIDRGPIPDGLLACHKCDDGRCCNPDHLFLGTVKDNAQDMVAKGRCRMPNVRGIDAWNAVYTDEQIEAVRSEYAAGRVTQKELAARLGVGQTTIGHWIRGEARAAGGVTKPRPVPAHGTRAGYFHHRRKSLTPPCGACLEANRVYMRAYKAARRGRVAS